MLWWFYITDYFMGSIQLLIILILLVYIGFSSGILTINGIVNTIAIQTNSTNSSTIQNYFNSGMSIVQSIIGKI